MKLKLIIALTVGIAIGAIGHRVWHSQTAISRHWNAVRNYNAYLRDPANYRSVGGGLLQASEPLDPMPHLAALVSAGELIYDDITLKSITYPDSEVTKHWITFCGRHHEEIVYVFGDTDPGPYRLQLWYIPRSQPLVDQLIEELEAIGSVQESTTSG